MMQIVKEIDVFKINEHIHHYVEILHLQLNVLIINNVYQNDELRDNEIQLNKQNVQHNK